MLIDEGLVREAEREGVARPGWARKEPEPYQRQRSTLGR